MESDYPVKPLPDPAPQEPESGTHQPAESPTDASEHDQAPPAGVDSARSLGDLEAAAGGDVLPPLGEFSDAPGNETDVPRISSILGPLPLQVSQTQTRDLNDVVHQILVIGLATSTLLLVIGLILDLLSGKQLPDVALSPREALLRVIALRPSGFLSLGLIVLLATPVIRVVGSIIVFIWERDWLYMLITILVLLVMTASVFLGQG